MRCLYSLAFYLALPLVLARVWWRGRKAPAYRRRWRERFALFPALPKSGCIWVHAVSVGETRAALPLIRELQKRYPDIPLLVTTTTPTGSQQVRDALGDSVFHVYAPYDTPDVVHRFLKRTQPRLTVIMETEIWPNLFHGCARARIPLLIANARLSERSARGYARFRGFALTTLKHALIAAQAGSDAARFQRLGVAKERVWVTGNIKFDLSLPEGLAQQGNALREVLGERRPVWIAASTHAGEDELVLDAFAQIRQSLPELLLLLVPRHPERFADVAELCRSRGFEVLARSERQLCEPRINVFLGDTMGELLLFYAAADVAFVGGSLVSTGGHNVLEPALLELPVVFGPHMFNFSEAAHLLLIANAAWQINNPDELATTVQRLLLDSKLRQAAGGRGKVVVESNGGALENLLDLIDDVLNDEGGAPGK